MDDTRWIRLEDKIDKITDTLGEVKITQAVEVEIREAQARTLLEHIKRTAQNEKMIYIIIACLLTGGAKSLGLFTELAKTITSF